MKITRIEAFQVELPYAGGSYHWGRGNVIRTALTTVITVHTDEGFTGCGESCPIGGNYLAAYAEGIVPALSLLAPAVIGEDPLEVHAIERRMDAVLRGHPYAKSAIDAACWDILGQSCGQPVCVLLGGRLTIGGSMYRVVPQKDPHAAAQEMEVHRSAGYRQFQIKVGNDWKADIDRIINATSLLEPGETAFADANRGWSLNEALAVVHAVRDTGVMIEQPCDSYDECLHVRRRTDLPMKLDECVTDLKMAQRVVVDQSAEVVCLKISNLGGLTKARRIRDYLVEHGLSVVCEDTWGGEITTAAVAHFAASTPASLLFNTTDLHNYNTVSTGQPPPVVRNGKLYAGTEPGLGVKPDTQVLGEPLAIYTES